MRRAERRSGHAQPDLLSLVEVKLGRNGEPAAAELVAAAEAFAALPSVEFAEIAFSRVPPPVRLGDDPCAVPPPLANGTAARRALEEQAPTPDYTPLQLYSRPDPGFDADWSLAEGADGRDVRYSDCEYCWIFDHEDVEMVKEEGHPCDPDMFADHVTSDTFSICRAVRLANPKHHY